MTLAFSSRAGRGALAASITASGMAFLDSSIVTVAAPHITEDLGGGFAGMQWVVDGYLLTLGALVLVGGALGDLLGKRRVFLVGTIGFGVASVLCALAPTIPALIAARMLQGAFAALMVPTSLALLNAVFSGADRGKAIGAWSGLSGVFTALGPFVGGFLVDTFSFGWRLAFLINIPLTALAVWLALRHVPDLAGTGVSLRGLDWPGAVLATAGLGLVVGPLIERGPWTAPLVVLGAVLLGGFVLLERRPGAMMPLGMFRVRTFSVANLVTFVVYGAFTAGLFLVTVYLQVGLGFSAVIAGASGLPITVLLVLGSSWVGGKVSIHGPRWFLTAGPLVMAGGLWWLGQLQPGDGLWSMVLPAMLLFAVGLVLVVAPVTTAALGDIEPEQSGTASGINNAVARVAGLLAIAVIPALAGMGDDGVSGYATAMVLCAAVCALGGVVSVVGFGRRA
jgi:EmrB/QacA subfamily drug resistance transporter